MKKRKVNQIVRGQQSIDGAGVRLRRVLGQQTIQAFDPFLMLDGFDSTNPEDYIKGFPWHPHRGMETVTYLINGSMEHSDSLENKGIIHDMGCQWMTAGSGIIHQEMPFSSPRMLGCQLWINLPAKDKMAPPAYREIKKEDINVVKEENATVRIVSGSYRGNHSSFEGEYIKVTYLDVELSAGSVWTYGEIPNDHTLFIYLLDGTLAADEKLKDFEKKGCAVLFRASESEESENEPIQVKAGDEGARFVLLAAKPLRETVSWGGPIVMNTKEEVLDAFQELKNNSFIKHK